MDLAPNNPKYSNFKINYLLRLLIHNESECTKKQNRAYELSREATNHRKIAMNAKDELTSRIRCYNPVVVTLGTYKYMIFKRCSGRIYIEKVIEIDEGTMTFIEDSE